MRAAATTLLLLSVLAWPFEAGANTVAVPDKAPSIPAATTVKAERLACSGCGCRGGGGYRLPSGKCAPRR
jgi:hypothetical protein